MSGEPQRVNLVGAPGCVGITRGGERDAGGVDELAYRWVVEVEDFDAASAVEKSRAFAAK
jgi:hypothetical protein